MALTGKKRMNLLAALVLALVLLPLGTFAKSEGSVSFTLAGYDGGTMSVEWKDNLFFERMEKLTGVSLTFDQAQDEKTWESKKQAYFTGEEPLPDGLFKANLTLAQEAEGYAKGVLIDLKPLLQEHAPNLYQLFQENPQWEKAVALPNGAIVSLPYIDLLRTQNAMWINSTWLTNLNIKAPTTKEELKLVLEAFRDQDPNQNGKKDEIPYTFVGPWDLKFLSHAFGQVANDYNIYVDEEGTVNFFPQSDSYYDMLVWLKQLYQEGLLDQQGFIQSDQLRSLEKDTQPTTYGIIMGPTPFTSLPEGHAKQYQLLAPLKDDDGKQTYRDFIGPIIGGTFAITSKCENPQALLQWADQLYTNEGAILAMAGEEGKEYTINEEGKWQTIQVEGSLNLQKGTILAGNFFPWYSPVDFELAIEDQTAFKTFEGMKKLGEVAKLPFPYYNLTKEDSDYIQPLQKELATYVDESLARFVTGEWVLTREQWKHYLDGLDQHRVEEFIGFWQKVFEEMQ